MEVHSHSHTARRKWTHYFWEFLMLFLAVFCGFLAEYQLEHKIEKDREKQFIRSMAADLEDDLNKISQYISREQHNILLLDSLCLLIDSPELAKMNGDAIYYTARVGPRTAPFVNNSRTFDQLRNSGGFRLIHKPETSNRIMDYFSRFPWIRLLEGNYTREFAMYKETASKVLDPSIFRRQENPDGTIRRSTDNPALLSYDRVALKQLEFHAVQMNGSRRSLMSLMQDLHSAGKGLMNYLRDNYAIQ